jgi:hypothetical protein
MEERHQILVRLEGQHQKLANVEVLEKDQKLTMLLLLKMNQKSLEGWSRVRQMLQTNLSLEMVEKRLSLSQSLRKNLLSLMREIGLAQRLPGAPEWALGYVVLDEGSGVHHPE